MAHRLYRRIAGALILALTPGAAAAADGAALYRENCALCHMADGSGVPHMQPPLAGSAITTGEAGAVIAKVLLGSDADVPGSGGYANLMPGFAHLSDRDIAAVISHIRAGFGNRADAVSTRQVATARGKLIVDGSGAGERQEWAEGATLFARNCGVCHFATGHGDEALPSISGELVRDEPRRLIERILVGSDSTMDVIGFESQGMPAFDRRFSDAEIAALVTFLRRRFGAADTAVTAADAARVRAEVVPVP